MIGFAARLLNKRDDFENAGKWLPPFGCKRLAAKFAGLRMMSDSLSPMLASLGEWANENNSEGVVAGGRQTAKYAKYANGNPVFIFAYFAWFAVELDATPSALMNWRGRFPRVVAPRRPARMPTWADGLARAGGRTMARGNRPPPPDFSGFPGLLRLFRRNPAFGRGDGSFMPAPKSFVPGAIPFVHLAKSF